MDAAGPGRRSSGPTARCRTSPRCRTTTRQLFRTAWELPQRALIDLAAARAPFIDQSQSLNLFLAAPTIGKLSSMYLHAWKSGLKTTYYLRSRPATRIQQATVAVSHAGRRRRRAAAADSRRGLLAGEPRDLRGVPVTATTPAATGPDGTRPGSCCSTRAWT